MKKAKANTNGKVYIGAKIPSVLADKLRAKAKGERRSVNAIIEIMLERELTKEATA